MKKKKIGILTFHHILNPGAILQAYAQSLAIKEKFNDLYQVEIIDYRYFSKEYSELRKIISNFIKLRKPIVNLKSYLKIKKFINSDLMISQNKLISNSLKKAIRFINNNYDVIIVGSDEIWKITNQKFSRNFPNIYWLPQNIKSIKIASAASANRLDYKKCNKRKLEIMSEYLNDFKLIGVRDDHTINMLKYLNYNLKNVYKVPDPTFSMEMKDKIYENVKCKLLNKGLNLNKPIFAFVMSSYDKKDFISKIVSNYFRKLNYQIVSLSMNNNYADIYLQDILDPIEWAHSFKYFDFCLTDRYHGTIFSLKNNTKFLTIDVEKRYLELKSKTNDLLNELNLNEHHINILKNDNIIDQIEYIIKKDQNNYDLNNFKNKYLQHLDRIKTTLKEYEDLI